jgi:hypothetical protein
MSNNIADSIINAIKVVSKKQRETSAPQIADAIEKMLDTAANSAERNEAKQALQKALSE